MLVQKEIITKKIFTDRIRSHIADNKWEDLIKLFQGAEEAKVSSTLLKSASKKIGEYLVSNSRYYEAIIFFNKSRLRDPKSKPALQSFINAVDLFFKENVEEFSKNDLAEFKQTILPIIDFHKLKFPAHRKIVDSTDHMFRRIDYRIKYVAKEVEESKVTFRVQQIKNSLYDDDMTIEERNQEFARLLVPKLREILDKEEDSGEEENDSKKKPKGKKKKGKKKDK